MSRKLIRDDIKAGSFLNRKLINSPTDYKKAHCYYYGDPIQLAISFFELRFIVTSEGKGCQAEFAVATGDNFSFDKRLIQEGLAIFFKNDKFNNIRLQALISPNNKQALRLARLSGFTQEGRLRNVAPDGDRLIYSLLKQEFINGRNIFGATRPANTTKSTGAS